MAAAKVHDTGSTDSVALKSGPNKTVQNSNEIKTSSSSKSMVAIDSKKVTDPVEPASDEKKEFAANPVLQEYDENQREVTIVVISDTHGHHEKMDIPFGDILIHCGDFTNFSNLKHLVSFNQWLGTLSIPKERRLVITGNHEIKQNFELKSGKALKWKKALCNGTMMNGKSVSLYGIRIHGVGWKGDNGSKGKWNGIPNDADIVITHNPPAGILDEGMGDLSLRERLEGIQPLLHLYGHAHSGYGIVVDRKRNIHYVNAASVNSQRKPVHSPIVLKVSKGKEQKLSVEVMNEEKESLFRDNADQKRSMKTMN